MTENQKIFCESVARLCEAANAPELFKPIIKLWAVYEDAQQTDPNKNTEVADIDMNKLTPEQSSEIQADMANISKMKQAEQDAKNKTNEASAAVAAKMNEFARTNEQNQEQSNNNNLAGTVNG